MTPIDAWRELPGLVEAVATGDLEAMADGGMTRRQLVHHLVEAHVVAASMVIAALGAPGCTYDWSWMQPFGPWLDRLGYGAQPIEPALALMRSLNAWVDGVVTAAPGASEAHALLIEVAGEPPPRRTLADIIQTEIDHVHGHCK